MTLYVKCDRCGKMVKAGREDDGWATIQSRIPGLAWDIRQFHDYCPECKGKVES